MVMVLLLLYYSKVDSQSQNNQEEEEHVEPTVVYQEEGMLSSAMILESHCIWLTALLLFACLHVHPRFIRFCILHRVQVFC